MQVDTMATSAAPASVDGSNPDISFRPKQSEESVATLNDPTQSVKSMQSIHSNQSNQSKRSNQSNLSKRSNQSNLSKRSNQSNLSKPSNSWIPSNRSIRSNASNQSYHSKQSIPLNESNRSGASIQPIQMEGSTRSISADKMYIPSLNGDSEEKYNRFLATNNNDYSVEEMKRFLKEGITKSGLRMLDTNHCEWYYDYYQATKTSDPPISELTPGTTIDYYYYTTPFQTQIGTINLVMMNSQVNFEDGTFAPADRSFKSNQITEDMIVNAKEAVKKYQR